MTTQFNDMPEGQTPVLSCEEIHPKLKEYMVVTSHDTVLQTIRLAEGDDLSSRKRVFAQSFHNLTKYSESSLNDYYTRKTQEWQDFCDDVLLFYVARLVLLKRPIPIRFLEDCKKHPNFPEMN